MNHTYVIGIDPGIKTGFALWHRGTCRFDEICTTDFWGAIGRVKAFGPHEVKVIIEVAHHAPTFRHLKAAGNNQHTLSKIARNVGQVTREAQLLVEGLRRCGYTVIELQPQGKVTQDKFKQLLSWPRATNQHERDAAMLAYGM